MEEDHKRIIQNIAAALITGLTVAAAVYVLIILLMRGAVLTEADKETENLCRILMPLLVGITSFFAVLTFRIEKREQKRFEQSECGYEGSGRRYDSVRPMTLYDAAEDKPNSGLYEAVYGGRVKPAADYGTSYTILKSVTLLMIFFSAGMTAVMIFMLISMK